MENVKNLEKIRIDEKFEKITKYEEIASLYKEAQKAFLEEKISKQDISFIEQQIKERFFSESRFEKIDAKVFAEKICPLIAKIDNFEIKNLKIISLGLIEKEGQRVHEELCVYKDKFLCILGINEKDFSNAEEYKYKKYMRSNYVEAIKLKVSDEKKAKIRQYEEYFIIEEEGLCRVFKEKRITALINSTDTVIEKIRFKLSTLLKNGVFTRQKNNHKFLPNMAEIYNSHKEEKNSNENVLNKDEAKNRMKTVLSGDRIRTRKN